MSETITYCADVLKGPGFEFQTGAGGAAQLRKVEPTRVQIDLPPNSFARLQALKEKTEASSYAEVTKNAYKLYERMIELAESESTLLVRDKNGKVSELELFF